jgi:AAA15 family ATPase/GTPase
MVATRENRHRETIYRVKKHNMGILPISTIFGGNASGKTNLCNALSFLQKMIVVGTSPDAYIGVEPFRLDKVAQNNPVRFKLEVLVSEILYELCFAVNYKGVVEENLFESKKNDRKVLLYSRNDDVIRLETACCTTEDDQNFLEYVKKGTRANQLFITNATFQNSQRFRPIYDWLKNDLILIGPNSRFADFDNFFDEDHPDYKTMNRLLQDLDTGISRLGGEVIPLESIPFSEDQKAKINETLKEGSTIKITSPYTPEKFSISRKNGELLAKRLVAYHINTDGSESKFELHQESDGSNRVIDVAPAFIDLTKQSCKKTYVIDELDRSLHTLLFKELITFYFNTRTSDTSSQLIFTSHNLEVFEWDELFRRDEIWFCERDNTGSTTLNSLIEYEDSKSDKHLKQSYLLGRMNGVPNAKIS